MTARKIAISGVAQPRNQICGCQYVDKSRSRFGQKEAVFKSAEVEALEANLFAIREKIFYTNSRSEKIRLEKQLTELRFRLKDEFTNLGFPNDKSDKITSWNPFDQNTHANWFDPEWMFGIKDGFDIVIGNPPYGIKFSENEKEYFKKHYLSTKTISGKQKGSLDSFSLFIEKGFNIMKRNGNLIYIVPISITSSDSMTVFITSWKRTVN
jgi:hypothetical protein